ncbi:MAG: glutamate--cysteine ligase [Burkholderiaceae bacterium]|jgi:glutamate--cysteine ligase|nr:glutamate--cysteine ligase [Burkholderiaceae bacterium]
MPDLKQRAASLTRERLRGIRRGIEKESLRVQPDGLLARTPHPEALGSPLTHPRITTDFSEAQIELVTGAHTDVDGCLVELTQLHQAVYRALAAGDGGAESMDHAEDGELLWVASMPCSLPADEAIPIGRYGTSNVARAKGIYRTGLSHRYGPRMQTISGIHYNWSLPGVSSDEYFGLIRNFRRQAFALLYLFGASPAVCASFAAGREHDLQPLGSEGATLYAPWATSLRMGRLGYQSDAQAALTVSYNGLESYAAPLQTALTAPYPPYEAIGIQDATGRYRQLSTTLLQLENEFYGVIRPKRVGATGERLLHALRARGVEYVEVRLMDLNPYAPIGIAADTARFLDLFLLYCLLADSPPDTPEEMAEIRQNQQLTATRGREPGLTLQRGGQTIVLTDWLREILDHLPPLAQALDAASGSNPDTGTAYRDALTRAKALAAAPQQLLSARVLQSVSTGYAGSFTAFVLAQSRAARQAIGAQPYPDELRQQFAQLARESITEQARIEAQDTLPFELYRRAYIAPEQLQPGRATQGLPGGAV